MKEHTEQHLDKLAKKVMQSSLLESPSLEFTANIIAKVEASVTSNITVYKPLISKRVWLLISILVIGSLSYGIFGSGLEGLGWFNSIDFSIISNNKITEAISGIRFSKTLMYAVGFFGLVFFIQIPMMKHYFDKRLDF
ncbi:hypothetical protein JYU05_02050 [bacterium AH-315-P13]|nr:hypothetical protein [bacterium AH-315-P13]MBN4085153.1 hypothetical protein [Flavobacteriaceae bacterium AH-315-B10]